MHKLAELDHRYVWHPFTQMKEWLERDPIVIRRGRGALLYDAHGKEYLDANSSIWTNLHGHHHPKLNGAIKAQLKKIAHSSALGLANEPASILAEKLVTAANPGGKGTPQLNKVFYSDDGSTAMEVALKLAYQVSRRAGVKEPRFLSLGGAYHGDTVGAVSLGHIDLFHAAYSGLLFKSDSVPAPYCYRCPFNKAKPERADARTWAKCGMECAGLVEQAFASAKKEKRSYTAMALEPLMQGAAGMIAQPAGYLKRVGEIVRENNGLLIHDEVMTGFGRCSLPDGRGRNSLFASQVEGVQPDFMALAKGLTGGYLPMAATLTTQQVFDAFLGEYGQFKTFFHGHSYTGNQLGAAAGIASLDLLQTARSQRARLKLAQNLRSGLDSLWELPWVGDIRQVGLVAGIELVRNWQTREPFALEEKAGVRVCESLARQGVLTRPIGNVLVVMPPYCTTGRQIKKLIAALHKAVGESFGTAKSG